MAKRKTRNVDPYEVEVLPPLNESRSLELSTKSDKRFSVRFRVTPEAVEITFDLWLRSKSKGTR